MLRYTVGLKREREILACYHEDVGSTLLQNVAIALHYVTRKTLSNAGRATLETPGTSYVLSG